MRTIFVVGILLICAFMAGWFTVQRDDEGTTVRFNRDEIRGDTRQVIDKGREFLDRNQQVYGEQPVYGDQQEYGDQQAYRDQVAQRPYQQPYGNNGQSGYDPQASPDQQQPATNPQYQQYQNQYQGQDYPASKY